MRPEEIVRRVWEELEKELDAQGCELVEVEFAREDVGDVLRLFIDREDGVTIDDCARVSRLVGPLLDKEDFIEQAYNLEVSSPGIARPIRKARDFERFIGERVRLKTVVATGGRRNYKGRLDSFKDGMVGMECDGTVHQIHLENIKRANLDR